MYTKLLKAFECLYSEKSLKIYTKLAKLKYFINTMNADMQYDTIYIIHNVLNI